MANESVAKTAPKPKGEGVGSRLAKFIKESWNETFHKSSWPSKQELRQFTIVVLFAILVVGAWIAGLDVIMRIITEAISGGRGAV